MVMVAMPVLDLIITAVWVGGLALFLVGQAMVSWWRFRYAARAAAHARRLSEATASRPAADADVLQFRARSAQGTPRSREATP
jgi:hypothetical protein